VGTGIKEIVGTDIREVRAPLLGRGFVGSGIRKACGCLVAYVCTGIREVVGTGIREGVSTVIGGVWMRI
jgi:2-phosphoglycerate kinase